MSNKQINDETNTRIYTRNIPTQQLQPYFDIKPMSTGRCSVFPIADIREPNNHTYPGYDINAVFNPGNRKAPWSGFSSKIMDESILRNQIYPLQKSNNATTYVPSSTSDLYVPLIDGATVAVQAFPLLSETYVPPVTVNPKPVDPLFFGNYTRYQLK
jgi:hypothetical protein